MENQQYRIHTKVRRRNESDSLDTIEFRSEDFDSDEEYCLAIASSLLETLRLDRDYLESQEEGE